MTLRVRLRFFALYRDLAGVDELALELPAGCTGVQLVEVLRARGGGLTRLPVRPALAVNHEYARLEHELRDGDEVALLPPVAGG